ncbi:hypothetical protein DL767_002622 [Monosporascus sp. MG133]|nr:hypothetical protein DL767_002622 [Monosporascus sp. MG133]
MFLYRFTLKWMFGMPKNALETYNADDSGPLATPYSGSNVAPEARIDYLLHQNFLRQWSGPNLTHTTKRFKRALRSRIDLLDFTGIWKEVDDFYQMFAKVVSASLIESIFGPALLRLNPGFVENLWTYDDCVPWLVRGVPSFLIPGSYRIRDDLRHQIKGWYKYARQEFHESAIDPDGDGDPFWGSEFVRYLQNNLSEWGHDDDALSAQDLGTIWG